MRAEPARRIPTGVAWAALIVLAWAVLTLFAAPSTAHAEDDRDGLLGGVTSLVGDTVSGATEVVKPVVTEVVNPVVTEVVKPVVETVVAPVQKAAPAVVETVTTAPVVAPVVKETADTVKQVTTPVTEALKDSPVSSVTDPVTDALTDVPVVGDLLSDLGLVDVLDSVTDTLDETVGVIGGVVDDTVPPVIDALDPPISIGDPGFGGDPLPTLPVFGATSPDTRADPDQDVAGDAVPGSSAIASLLADGTAPAMGIPSAGAPASLPAGGDPPQPFGAPAHAPPGSPPTSSAGSGGGSFSDGARLGGTAGDPLRAGLRAPTTTDDSVPPSPVRDTDVSPD